MLFFFGCHAPCSRSLVAWISIFLCHPVLFYSTGQFLKRPRCHPRESEALLHGSLMSFCVGRNPEKKYKYSKFLKLKARFISLYAGFPPTRE
ncbi:hypothetical protein [Rickettsia asembonensis]|uniref:hypothetical protein n=1 Tax=Rickettsia asembonensis TaxID=1068590 RepID=UPI0011BAB9A7|nr:hypothetical protein [Rickettsia asembonensis]